MHGIVTKFPYMVSILLPVLIQDVAGSVADALLERPPSNPCVLERHVNHAPAEHDAWCVESPYETLPGLAKKAARHLCGFRWDAQRRKRQEARRRLSRAGNSFPHVLCEEDLPHNKVPSSGRMSLSVSRSRARNCSAETPVRSMIAPSLASRLSMWPTNCWNSGSTSGHSGFPAWTSPSVDRRTVSANRFACSKRTWESV